VPVSSEDIHKLHKLVRHPGLKIGSVAREAFANEIANAKSAYAYARNARRENVLWRLKPLRDIARNAAAVAKTLDEMKAFQALTSAIADIAERDEIMRANAPESASNDLEKPFAGPLGSISRFSILFIPRTLTGLAERAEAAHELIAAPSRRPGRRAVEAWRCQRLVDRI
jgi:hypothetical protein